jgi:hypothetical protein
MGVPLSEQPAAVDLRKVVESLPLEECTGNKHHLTGEFGYQAPEDRIFRMTGEFYEDSEANVIDYWEMPQPSRAELMKLPSYVQKD